MHDAEGNLLCLVPESTAPVMIDIAYRLYVRGLERGIDGGIQAAWAKLRTLIGAATDLGG